MYHGMARFARTAKLRPRFQAFLNLVASLPTTEDRHAVVERFQTSDRTDRWISLRHQYQLRNWINSYSCSSPQHDVQEAYIYLSFQLLIE